MAKLYFRYGAMNSGKTTALLQVAFNYKERGMRVVILKASIDTKGGDAIVSRLGVSCKVDHLVRPETDIFALIEADIEANGRPACVLCDESQFFTPAQAEQLFLVTVDLGIPVICYGLRADFMMRGFPGSTRLLELAHSIEEMKTICACGRKAMCNGRPRQVSSWMAQAAPTPSKSAQRGSSQPRGNTKYPSVSTAVEIMRGTLWVEKCMACFL